MRSRLSLHRLALAAVAGSTFAGSAHAAYDLSFRFDGLDLTYDGNLIEDVGSAPVALGTGDPLTSFEFFVNGQTRYTDNTVLVDLELDIGTLPTDGTPATGDTGRFDIFFDTTFETRPRLVQFDIVDISVTYDSTTTQVIANIEAFVVGTQFLPLGLQFDENEPLNIVLFSDAAVVNGQVGFIGSALGDGDGQGVGEPPAVPEPAALTMLGPGRAAAAASLPPLINCLLNPLPRSTATPTLPPGRRRFAAPPARSDDDHQASPPRDSASPAATPPAPASRHVAMPIATPPPRHRGSCTGTGAAAVAPVAAHGTPPSPACAAYPCRFGWCRCAFALLRSGVTGRCSRHRHTGPAA